MRVCDRAAFVLQSKASAFSGYRPVKLGRFRFDLSQFGLRVTLILICQTPDRWCMMRGHAH